MELDSGYIKETIAEYRSQITPLIKYLPWLEQATEKSASTMYKGSDASESGMLTFPVYDATLMSFIREAGNSSLMDRNYMYVFTRRGLRTPADERAAIEACDYKSWDVLRGILSKYVLGGRTRAVLWSQGVSEKIFYLVLMKMNDIVTYWDSEKNI